MNEVDRVSSTQEEKEPIYYVPKRVSLFSDIASILSWVVLVGFLGDVVMEVFNIQSQMKTQSLAFATLIKEPSFLTYLFVNMLIPLLTGLVFFVVLQAAANGLNVLLEMDFNAREARK